MPTTASKKSKTKKPKKKKKGFSANSVDKHDLYELSVQNPKEDVKFLNKVFKKEHGRRPLSLKEDFCGTAWMCAEWVQSHDDRTAMGVDLDAKTQQWGHRKHIEPLGDVGGRIDLRTENVLQITEPKVDVIVAFNFSYCTFQTRDKLVEYFRMARESLNSEGLFTIDIHGGPESFEELEEETDHDDFTYVWDQEPINPVNHRARRAIHFRFPDGTEIKNAFIYDWRVWQLPELREILLDAGFSRVDVYWEGFDKDGEGNGVFKRVEEAENDESWIAYILGWV